MIPQGEMIERWGHAEGVLVAMPEHERLHHWNMGFWGERTACGAVACAAGHCGLDPWFQERGFKLHFSKSGEAIISDVPSFFGLEGSTRIFYNSTRRPVEKVIDEVRAYKAELEQIASLTAATSMPAIGEEWPEQGGICAGVRLGKNGQPNYILVVGPEGEATMNWHDATKWVSGLVVGEHRGFTLPDPDEQQALFDRVRALFQRSWYWSRETHEDYPSNAWTQSFSYGVQSIWAKGGHGRARAVRRVVI